jgi:hypothetical protein
LPADFPPDERLAPPDLALVDEEPRADDLLPDDLPPDDLAPDDLAPDAVPRASEDGRDREPEDLPEEDDFFAGEGDFFPDDFAPPALAREDAPPLPPLPPDERRAEPLDLAFAMKPPDLFGDVVIAVCITAAGGKGIFSGRSAQVAPAACPGETCRRAPRRRV